MIVDDLELELRRLPGVRATGFVERDGVLLVQVQVTGEHVEPGLGLHATRIAYRHSDLPVAVEIVRWRTPPPLPASAPAPAPAPAAPAGGAAAGGAPEAEPGMPAPANGEIIGGEAGEESTIDTTADVGLEAEAVAAGGMRFTREPRVRLLAVLTFPDTDELEVHLTFAGRRSIGRAAASRGVLGAVEATLDGLRVFLPDLAYVASWAKPMDNGSGRQSYLVACGLIAGDGGGRFGIAAGASPIEAASRSALHALNRSIAPELAGSVDES